MLPRLLHITKIYIKQKNPTNTLYDNNAREPVGRVARGSTVILDGQVMWKRQQVYVGDTGVVLNTDGYILFRQYDLTKKGITLEQGDNIIQMGTGSAAVDMNLYIDGFEYRGHYADQGGHSLVKAYFVEKQPAAR